MGGAMKLCATALKSDLAWGELAVVLGLAGLFYSDKPQTAASLGGMISRNFLERKGLQTQ
ncbi:MAG: hypothetical protein ACI906_003980 [Candidatus Latescibacterota bacterium]|jgi:hypothetical protein